MVFLNKTGAEDRGVKLFVSNHVGHIPACKRLRADIYPSLISVSVCVCYILLAKMPNEPSDSPELTARKATHRIHPQVEA
jgi:hypothetical protein